MDNQKLIESMKHFYDRRASIHDELMNFKGQKHLEQVMKPILVVIKEHLDDRHVLELACGTGNWTLTLGSRARQMTAIDSSPRSLEIARKKLAGRDNVFLLNADVFKLPLSESSFDTVFTADFYTHILLTALPNFWNAVAALVAPGGHVVVVDMTEREASRLKFCRYDENGNRLENRELPDGSVTEVVKNFPDEAEIREAASQHFEKISFKRFDDLERWLAVCSR